jgi:hypothetical protein
MPFSSNAKSRRQSKPLLPDKLEQIPLMDGAKDGCRLEFSIVFSPIYKM